MTFSSGEPGSAFAPVSTLMPGIDALAPQHFDERRAVGALLADRLVVQDHAADELADARRA